MPDQDEFAPITRNWQGAYDAIVSQAYPEQIAQLARTTLKRMLKASGGCPTLPRLVVILDTFAHSIEDRDAPGWHVSGTAETSFEHSLDDVAYCVDNRRIDAVAVRTCRVDGIRLAERVLDPSGESLGTTLATDVLVNVVRHSLLDQASAHSVGVRYDDVRVKGKLSTALVEN